MWVKCFTKFANHCILFLFTYYTVSQLLGNCFVPVLSADKIPKTQQEFGINFYLTGHLCKDQAFAGFYFENGRLSGVGHKVQLQAKKKRKQK